MVIGETEPQVDLLSVPDRKANISAQGAGCCTFRSAEYAARWQNVPALFDFPEWIKSTGRSGGGYPKKQAEYIDQCCKERGFAPVKVMQYDGPAYAKVIERILGTGRLACVTFGSAHMLNCVHLDATQCGICDNNSPNRIQWFSRDEGLRKIAANGRSAWCYALAAPPPPPCPIARTVPGPFRDPFRLARNCDCPASCSCGCQAGFPCRCAGRPIIARQIEKPTGCDWKPRKDIDNRGRYRIGADTVSEQDFYREFENDDKKRHLTIIGSKEECAAVMAAVAGLAPQYHIQEYRPGAWPLANGHSQAGHPTVYVQDRAGRVLLRADKFVSLADLDVKLRRTDPAYTPASDPTGSPMPAIDFDAMVKWGKANPLIVLIGAGLLLWFFTRRK